MPHLLLLLLGVLLCSSAAGCKSQRKNAEQSEPYVAQEPPKELLRECPDAWIVNRMPSVGEEVDSKPRQYFVYNDKRVEIAAVDTAWVRLNCDVQIMEVH